MKPEKRQKRELMHKGNIVDFYCDTVETQAGHITTFDFIKHKGAAAIVPVREDGKILMVRQYRNAVDRVTLEVPAGGKNDIEEPSEICVARELEEETGYRSENIEHLINIYTTFAFCDEQIDIYVAHDLIPSSQNLDEDEFIDLEAYSLDEIIGFIMNGTIMDAKTIAAVLAYKQKYFK